MAIDITQEQFDRGDAYGLDADDYRLVDAEGNAIVTEEPVVEEPVVEEPVVEEPVVEEVAEEPVEEAPVEEPAAEEPVEVVSDSPEEEAEAPQSSSHMIPKFRYDHQKARNERLERELNELKAQLSNAPKETPAASPAATAAPAASSELVTQNNEPSRVELLLTEKLNTVLIQKNEALVAGDAKKAAELDLEVFRLQGEITSTRDSGIQKPVEAPQPQTSPEQMRQQIRMEMMLEDAVDEAISTYAEFNEASGKYNEQIVNRVVALQQTMIAEGMSALEAFNEALDTYAPRLTNLNAPAPKAAPAPRKTDVKKNIEAAKSQPPALTEVTGRDSDKSGLQDDTPNVQALSFEEFEKLPAEVRRRMRGDYVAS